MALTRHDALKLLNVVVQQLAPAALDGVGLEVAMISVWGVYSHRIDNACALIAQKSVILTPDELIELGTFWIRVWQLGERPTARACPLCNTIGPIAAEYLCGCFQEKRVGLYIDYTVPGVIQSVAQKNPGTWQQLSAESFICNACQRVIDIPLGKIAERVNQGRSWKTPNFCKKCSYNYHRKRQTEQDSNPLTEH